MPKHSNTKDLSKYAIGALLIAGLFAFAITKKSSNDLNETERVIKPSDLDFANSNRPKEPTENPQSTESTEKTTITIKRSDLGADQSKWDSVQEIIDSKNDNDPRIDNELRNLSPKMHQALTEKYLELAEENRNGRGLVAFLIARDLKDENDANFLKSVFEESPCTSFEKCSSTSSHDVHQSGMEQVSLNYPQMAILYQVESKLTKDPSLLQNPDQKSYFSRVVGAAEQFPVEIVQNKAIAIKNKFGL